MRSGMKMLMFSSMNKQKNNSIDNNRSENRVDSRNWLPYDSGIEMLRGNKNSAEYQMDNRNESIKHGDMDGNIRNNLVRYNYNVETNYNEAENQENQNQIAESRKGGRRYRRDKEGRFMPKNEHDMTWDEADDVSDTYPSFPYIPPPYDKQAYNRRWNESGLSTERNRPMNRIGFAMEPSSHDRTYRQDAEYQQVVEMENKRSSMKPGFADSDGNAKLTREMAEEWMMNIRNEDGTKGAHWSFDQAKQVMAQKGVKADPIEFYAVLNTMYADYCKVFKKYGVGDKLDFYVDMAKAFIEDKDAEQGKVANYFYNIVKR